MDVSSSVVLTTLLLCALMGGLGQGIRAAIGLKNAGLLQPRTPGRQSEFDVAYFLVSMMIGAVAGIMAGLVVGLDQLIVINISSLKVLLGIAVSGYAGADFIENSMSRVLPGIGNTQSVGPVPAPQPPRDPGPSQASEPLPTDHVRAQLPAPRRMLPGPAGHQPVAGGEPAAPDPALADALRVVAPAVSTPVWVPALSAGFRKFGLTTDRRMAAALGQFLVEAGSGLEERVEDLRYTHAGRLTAVFPDQFRSEEAAEPYVDNPVALANLVYANRLGNGDVVSGDGYRFRGHGLIQLTGRDEFRDFGESLGLTAEQAVTYCETPLGAAMSGCWYLAVNHCLPLADIWALSQITRRVNGPALEANHERLAYANAILRALAG